MSNHGDPRVQLPDTEEMARRLREVSDDKHLTVGFYGLLIPHAGRELTGTGVALMFERAFILYTQRQTTFVAASLAELIERHYVPALVEDPEVRNEVLARLREAQILPKQQ